MVKLGCLEVQLTVAQNSNYLQKSVFIFLESDVTIDNYVLFSFDDTSMFQRFAMCVSHTVSKFDRNVVLKSQTWAYDHL